MILPFRFVLDDLETQPIGETVHETEATVRSNTSKLNDCRALVCIYTFGTGELSPGVKTREFRRLRQVVQQDRKEKIF